MSKIDASEILKDASLVDDGSGNLKQAAGTDGGGDATIPVAGSDVSYDDSGASGPTSGTSTGQAAIAALDAAVDALTPASTGVLIISGAGGWASDTAGASGPSPSVINGVTHQGLIFADSGSPEYSEISMRMPDDYQAGGALTFEFYWSAPTGATNSVVWEARGLAYGDGDSMNGTYGTPVVIADANTGNNFMNVSASTPAMTLAGAAQPGDFVQLKFGRLSDNVSDELAASVPLLMLKAVYQKV